MKIKQMLTKLANVLFPSPHKNTGAKILFYKDTNSIGTHGMINVTNLEKGIDRMNVRFVYEGMATPPDMNPAVLLHLWHEAEVQGYIPHRLVSYGKVIETVVVPLQQLVSAEQRQKEAFVTGSTRHGAHTGADRAEHEKLVDRTGTVIAIDRTQQR